MSEKKIIIAIDGFSSSGKSTMARNLAKSIGYKYIDSGAMYRAVALYALEYGYAKDDKVLDCNAIINSLPDIHIDFETKDDGQHTILNGRDVEKEIRSLNVSNIVSPIAAIPDVRARLAHLQNLMGIEKGIVMDGRDIGTTVFPNAELKIFVNAPAEVRAERRVKELAEKGFHASYPEVLQNLQDRDYLDSTREISPLRQAKDAVLLDNSGMSLEEQNEFLLSLVEQRLKES